MTHTDPNRDKLDLLAREVDGQADRTEQMVADLWPLVDAAEYSELNENGDAVGIARYLIANRAAVLRALGVQEEFGRVPLPGGTWQTQCRFATDWEDVTDD